MFVEKFRGLALVFIISCYISCAALAANPLPKPVIGIVDIQKVLRVSNASKSVQLKIFIGHGVLQVIKHLTITV